MTITPEEQNVMLNEAKMASFIGEYISQFNPQDIDGDDIDLRFEVDGFDTGCDISIIEQFGKTAAVIDKLLAHIDAQTSEISRLNNELKKANEYVEKFERESYLMSDKAEAAEKELSALSTLRTKYFCLLTSPRKES